ncbi:LIM domain-binding protein 3 [Pyrenophora tritici-repentis]|nr:LIM domain-binding protein 3 [Pyrenophora tritici-repentis]KAI0615103.1 LIM domain-binding protein 3 [Pyrenophora tritici-repentis]KAI0627406.1 LIM domain-binding protein 3 [Pyrenophora tritici-repentis]
MFTSKEREGASSPGPGAYYSPSQMKSYLQDLRTNRPARPTGARPAPAHFNTWSNRASNRMSDSHTVASLQRTFTDPAADVDARPASSHEPKRHSRTPSKLSIDEVVKGPGRPVVQPPRGRNTSSRSSSPSRISSVQYREREQRQVEQDEARAIRVAMEDLELAQEEKLFEAARDEAAELVWKHCNPHAAENNPNAPYSYPGLAKKGSAPRSRSVEPKDQDLQRANSKLRKRHSMSSAASGSRSSSLQSNGQGGSIDTSASNTSSTKGKKDESPALAKAISDLPDFKQRRRSSGARRTTSGSLFQNPNDQIYEEPEEEAPPAPIPRPAATAEPPKSEKLPLGIRRNPFMRFQSIKGNPMMRSNTDPTMASKRLDRYEIQKNPPTQSRNAAYTLNSGEAKPAEPAKADVENVPEVKMKDGKEIRSDELRAATGFRLKDRSPKLPTPTAVSDAPGRPIVSFKKDWNIIELKEEISAVPDLTPRPLNPNKSGPPPLEHAATAPVVPIISLAPDMPTRSTTPRPPATAEAKRSSVLAPEVPNRSTTPRPTTPSSRNAAPTSWIGRQAKPAINIYEDPPTPAPTRPLPLVSSLRKANIPTRPSASPVPTINVSESPSARSRTTQAPPIPSISVAETPSISVNGPTSRRSNTLSTVATPPIPSISVSESSVSRGTRGTAPGIPSISVNETPAPRRGAATPSINVTPDVPTISVNQSPAPTRGRHSNTPSVSVTPAISVKAPSGFGPAASTRPLPIPNAHNKSHSFNGTPTSRGGHWTPTTVRTGALCTQCALPIAGRIVSAGGSRFHPECFACYQCGEHLECVAFYPEPSNKHAERVHRIRARLSGQDIPYLPSHATAEDMARLEHDDGTDESPRFYCHLDFHELFSPRCKSCKTPIEGEVIVACGAEWHAGHFFCAQCGDPFDSTTPFVEKDGYAWCVNCHTHRYSTKCKGCRKPVTDTVVKALGAEWHVGCFVCVVCSGPFQDGRYFLRGESEDPVCVRCEERRLKA